MGAAKSTARRARNLQESESARAVLSRREAAGKDKMLRVEGGANRKKPIFHEYSRKVSDEMSKMFTVHTKYEKTAHTTPDGTQVAPLIRFHRDNKVESDKKKGIVQGKAQLSEFDLINLIASHEGNSGELKKVAKELNVSIDEAISIIRSVRVPKYVKMNGENIAI